MPAASASQQRLFGMVHAYQKGKLKKAPKKVRELAERISEEDASHFARTSHDGLPEKKGAVKMAAAKPVGMTIGKKSVVFPTMKAAVLYLANLYGIKRSEATKAIHSGASGLRGIRFFRPQTKQVKRASDETKKKIDRLRKKLYRGFDSKKDWEARFPDGSTIDIRQFEKGIPQELADKVLVSGGDHFLERRRGLCHERADAEMKYLRENGIDAGRFFADLHDDYTPYWLLLDHSFPYYHDEDGYAMIGKKVKGRPQFTTKREAAEQFLRNTIADGNFGGEGINRMRIYDTTDVPMKDDESFKKFKRRMIRKGILLLDKKASDMGLDKRVTRGLA